MAWTMPLPTILFSERAVKSKKRTRNPERLRTAPTSLARAGAGRATHAAAVATLPRRAILRPRVLRRCALSDLAAKLALHRNLKKRLRLPTIRLLIWLKRVLLRGRS